MASVTPSSDNKNFIGMKFNEIMEYWRNHWDTHGNMVDLFPADAVFDGTNQHLMSLLSVAPSSAPLYVCLEYNGDDSEYAGWRIWVQFVSVEDFWRNHQSFDVLLYQNCDAECFREISDIDTQFQPVYFFLKRPSGVKITKVKCSAFKSHDYSPSATRYVRLEYGTDGKCPMEESNESPTSIWAIFASHDEFRAHQDNDFIQLRSQFPRHWKFDGRQRMMVCDNRSHPPEHDYTMSFALAPIEDSRPNPLEDVPQYVRLDYRGPIAGHRGKNVWVLFPNMTNFEQQRTYDFPKLRLPAPGNVKGVSQFETTRFRTEPPPGVAASDILDG